MGDEALLLSKEDPEDIRTAAKLLRGGCVVALPTDTVYGLAACVFRPAAVSKIFTVKGRAAEMAVPVLLASAAELPLLVTHVPVIAWNLINKFWPGPLTLVLPARPAVPPSVTGGLSTVAVRVPASKSCLEVLEVLGEPVVGTSANIHGQPPALSVKDVQSQLGDKIDAILADDESVRVGVASTVVGVRDDECIVFRSGAVTMEELRSALGTRIRLRH
ncbi:MAG: hypothetical protein NVSMB52_02850 [Chloroflexota bacterium]